MGWYDNLDKPWWAPPSSWFGPVWTVIYICYIVFGVILLYDQRSLSTLVILYLIAWVVNVVWIPLFRESTSVWSPIYILFLLTLILAIAWFAWREGPPLSYATVLLLPYVVWLVIASTLGFVIAAWN
jgi:benzodiazapine receptor